MFRVNAQIYRESGWHRLFRAMQREQREGVRRIGVWLKVRKTRRVLAQLDDHQLCDIGLTRAQAQRPSAAMFWVGNS